MDGNFFLHAETPPLEDGPDGGIDALNNETFGSGAIEEDWEVDHVQFAADFQDEEDMELANQQQLAAAVEELVLNSDQDQDAIDPAIVSLRKEPSSANAYQAKFNSELLSPYLDSDMNKSNQNYFLSDGMKSIWGKPAVPQSKLNNGNYGAKRSPSPIEDAAILTAVKANTGMPVPRNWTPDNVNGLSDFMGKMHTGVMRAEDLEREFNFSARSTSPTYGISIPKQSMSQDGVLDRSLPARSVSPVIGSPPSHEMPIGTPPNRPDSNLGRFRQTHHPRFPMGFPGNGPYPVPIAGPVASMGMPPQPWPPYPSPHNFQTPAHPEILQRLALSRNMPLTSNGVSPGQSPVGSPRFNIPMPVRPLPPHPFMRPMQNNMSGTPPRLHGFGPDPRFLPPPMSGPGHLHPEHRRFVFMRQQQRSRQYHNNRNQNYNRRQNRDPYAHLMTNREKEWVIKIQMMALQSDRPEIDDYYYQNYIEKQLQQGGLDLDDEDLKNKRLLTPTKTNPDNKKYIPVQFKDSLGKLTVSSVYSPRQVIDVVHKTDEDVNESENKQAISRRFEIYKTVEKLYDCVMEIDEDLVMLEKQNVSPETKENLSIKVSQRKSDIETTLKLDSDMTNEAYDVVSHVFRIRKGKRILTRCLPYLSKEHSLVVILSLFKNLPIAIKRDTRDQVLSELYFPLCEQLELFNSDSLMQTASAITASLSAICKGNFGVSLVCKLLCLGNQLLDLQNEASDNGKAWINFKKRATSILVTMFGMDDSEVHLLDPSLSKEVVKVLKSSEKVLLSIDHRNHDIIEKQFGNAISFFSAITDQKT